MPGSGSLLRPGKLLSGYITAEWDIHGGTFLYVELWRTCPRSLLNAATVSAYVFRTQRASNTRDLRIW